MTVSGLPACSRSTPRFSCICNPLRSFPDCKPAWFPMRTVVFVSASCCECTARTLVECLLSCAETW